MPTQDKLEIIGPNGDIVFYELDIEQGVTNIGRDPANDIVLDDADIALFQAIVDHRQKPYQLTVLSNQNEITVEGESLGVSEPKTLQNWANITIGDFTLILVEEVETTATRHPNFVTTSPGGSVIPAAPPQVEAAPVYMPPTTVPTSPILSPPEEDMFAPIGLPNRVTTRPHDEEDEVIITELSENQWQVDVEQMSTCQLTIVNGGDIVAAFEVGVQGLDPSWVVISEPYVNLFEGERATITLTITPPHAPNSRAGAHHFAIIVTSSNYPGRMSRRGATLTINPYYEFSVEELSPKRQTLSWSKRSGQVTLPINNMGNSATPFRLEGADDERACSFEFDVPGETIALATQAELRLYPEESIAVPIRVTPLSRRFIAFRKRSYPYTITTSLTEGPQTSRSMLGELSHRPLIGPWILLLALILFMVGIVFFFMPGPNPGLHVYEYSSDGNEVKEYVHRVSATDNQITLDYNVSRFRNINATNILNTINAGFLDVTLERKISDAPDSTYEIVEATLDAPFGAVSDEPTEDVVYRLTVENFLSKFLFSGLKRQATWSMGVKPQLPTVKLGADRTDIELGQSAVLTWTQQYATRLELKTSDGIPLETIDSPDHEGTFSVQPESDTTYKLEAHNIYTENDPVEVATTIKVFVPPTPPPPTPTPSIAFFTASPPTIVEGEGATLKWRVNGAEVVTIEGLDSTAPLPAEHTIEVWPTVSTDYILIVPDAPELPPMTVRIDVLPATATPTPVPGAPEISFFVADEDEIVKGDSTDVTLTWSVVGTTTNVELSSAELPNPLSNLPNDGAFTISLDDTALFVLTAFNGPAKASRTVQIEGIEPTPIPPPPPPPVLPTIAKFTANPEGKFTTCNSKSPESINIILGWTIEGPHEYISLYQIDKSGDILLISKKKDELEPPITVTLTLDPDADPKPIYRLKALNATGDFVWSDPVEVILPPVAVDDQHTMNEDEKDPNNKIIDVTDNDCDPPSDEIENYTLSIDKDPNPGTAVPIQNNTKIQYTPKANFNGSDLFTYELCDITNRCDTATVEITVNPDNDAPVANDDYYQTLEDMLLTVNAPGVLGNDNDPVEGDNLTIASMDSPTPNGGTVTYNNNNNNDGSFIYTPGQDYCGPDSFNYTVIDDGTPKPASAVGKVTIQVICVNDGPPVLTVDKKDIICSKGSFEDCTNGGTVEEPADIEETSVTLSASIGTLEGTVDSSVKIPIPGSWTWTYDISKTATGSTIQVKIEARDSDGLTGFAFFDVTVTD